MASDSILRPGELKDILLKEIQAATWLRSMSAKSAPSSK